MQGSSCSNPNPNPRNPRKELKSFMKPQEDIEQP